MRPGKAVIELREAGWDVMVVPVRQRVPALLWLALGVVLFIGGLSSVLVASNQKENLVAASPITTGRVSAIADDGGHHRAAVAYSVGDVTYTASLLVNLDVRLGDAVGLQYKTGSPSSAWLEGDPPDSPWGFGILGLLPALFMVGAYLRQRHVALLPPTNEPSRGGPESHDDLREA